MKTSIQYKFSLALSFLAAAVAMAGPLFALPIFHTGIYYQSEPVILALNLVSTLACIALLLELGSRRPGPLGIPPACLVALAISLLTIIFSGFHDYWLRSWTGSPEFGDGGASYLWIAVFLAIGYRMYHVPVLRRAVLGLLVGLPLCVALLQLYSQRSVAFEYFGFSDYLALYPFTIWLVLLSSWANLSSLYKVIFFTLSALVTLFLVTLSASSASSLALMAGLLVLMLGFVLQRLTDRPIGLKLVLGTIVSLTLGAGVCVYLLGTVVNPEAIRFESLPLQTLWSRYQLYQVALQALSESESGWLTGLGWGSFRDALVTFGMGLKGVHYQVVDGILVVNWPALDRAVGHSHNVFLEALLSLGIMGPILLVLLLFSLFLGVSPPRRYLLLALLVGQVSILSLWFVLPMLVAYTSIAIGLFLASEAAGQEDKWFLEVQLDKAPKISRIVLVLMIFVLSATTLQSVVAADYGNKLLSRNGIEVLVRKPTAYTRDGHVHISGFGEEREGRALQLVAHSLVSSSDNISSMAEKNASEELLSRLSGLTVIVDPGSNRALTPYLLYSRLYVRYLISADGRFLSTGTNINEFMSYWPDDLLAFAEAGSTREELVISYLMRLYSDGNQESIISFCALLADMVTASAGCDLFVGMVKVNQSKSIVEGRGLIQRSIDLGVERFIVLPEPFYATYLPEQ